MAKPRFERGDAFIVKSGTKPKWIVKDLIPSDSIVLISGPPKRGKKTWLAFTIGMSVAANKPVAGKIIPLQPGTVLIVEEEGSRQGTQDRLIGIDKLVGGQGLTNLFVAHRHRLRLDDEDCVKAICQQVKLTSARIVILDALTYLHQGDPNSEKDMQKVISGINDIRSAMNGGAVLLIHHLNKSFGEERDRHPDSQVRGSGAIAGAYDTHLACRSYSKKADNQVALDVIHREAAESSYMLNWTFEPEVSLTMKDNVETTPPKREIDPPTQKR